MEQNDITAYLERKGVKPTANRILVLKTLKESDRPMCLSDLENELITMDKSSIFNNGQIQHIQGFDLVSGT